MKSVVVNVSESGSILPQLTLLSRALINVLNQFASGDISQCYVSEFKDFLKRQSSDTIIAHDLAGVCAFAPLLGVPPEHVSVRSELVDGFVVYILEKAASHPNINLFTKLTHELHKCTRCSVAELPCSLSPAPFEVYCGANSLALRSAFKVGDLKALSAQALARSAPPNVCSLEKLWTRRLCAEKLSKKDQIARFQHLLTSVREAKDVRPPPIVSLDNDVAGQPKVRVKCTRLQTWDGDKYVPVNNRCKWDATDPVSAYYLLHDIHEVCGLLPKEALYAEKQYQTMKADISAMESEWRASVNSNREREKRIAIVQSALSKLKDDFGNLDISNIKISLLIVLEDLLEELRRQATALNEETKRLPVLMTGDGGFAGFREIQEKFWEAVDTRILEEHRQLTALQNKKKDLLLRLRAKLNECPVTRKDLTLIRSLNDQIEAVNDLCVQALEQLDSQRTRISQLLLYAREFDRQQIEAGLKSTLSHLKDASTLLWWRKHKLTSQSVDLKECEQLRRKYAQALRNALTYY
eukprot:Blabericola_migrator_1__6765@NODE_341_length_9595_cov_269_238980_g274_i0_p1_GENE_NODE_341_length_9595_cov_269_238980_g274_i0NODE_341_length_9595_cov_269_238980_g274_i0_p1_ORF_typecomplete_len524_score70_18DUF5358/PF17311_2/5_7e02DUF5358/PF17311_2/1_1Taxilin/PF09728_9/1_1e02_NODE_341_length_9595_cov_269_238980_g274_i033924963